jgi:hypothetical protein
MDEVDNVWNGLSRATQEAKAEAGMPGATKVHGGTFVEVP